MSSLPLQPKKCLIFLDFPMKNVVKIFGIPMSSLGGVHQISGIAQSNIVVFAKNVPCAIYWLPSHIRNVICSENLHNPFLKKAKHPGTLYPGAGRHSLYFWVGMIPQYLKIRGKKIWHFYVTLPISCCIKIKQFVWSNLSSQQNHQGQVQLL